MYRSLQFFVPDEGRPALTEFWIPLTGWLGEGDRRWGTRFSIRVVQVVVGAVIRDNLQIAHSINSALLPSWQG